MRKKIVAGNWKMNMTLDEGKNLVSELLADLSELNEQNEVVLCPPFIHLQQASTQLTGKNNIYVGAQNCSDKESGAYTGEVSAAMISSVGSSYVIIGHSERREYFNESNAQLAEKVNQALSNDLKVIFCCGEPLEVRDADTQNSYVETQIKEGIFHLSAEQMKDIVIAYEPIWAIGTGRTASAQQAQDMHAHIRSVVAEKYGNDIADATSILYGGSCKPTNAEELFAGADVDGGLIGGAALKASDFLGIIKAMLAS